MKKDLCIISFLFACITLRAQDIYTSGYFTNDSGPKIAAVFKNGEVILSREEPGRDLFSSAMVIDTLNGDIYWAVNSNPVGSISDGYSYVMRNDEILLENVFGTGINDITLYDGDVYAAGYMNDIYSSTAAVWKNGDTTPLYTYAENKVRAQAMGVEVVDGVVYACGYYEEGLNYGCVWRNDELYAGGYPAGKVREITCDDGEIYYFVEDYNTIVYQSGQELFTLNTNAGHTNSTSDIKIGDGDIYTVGFMGWNDCCVWKNADLLYIHASARGADFNACYFYDHSLYYVGYDYEDHGVIFKDGEQLFSLKFKYFYDVWVMPSPLAVEEIKAGDSSVVYIYNFFGELVKTVCTDDNNLSISDLPSGFYIAKRGKEVTKVFSTKVE